MVSKLSDEWDARFYSLAKSVSDWSKDPKARVGAVILDERHWPTALGYNGFPAGVEDDVAKLNDQELKNDMVVHAEQNALLHAGYRARHGSIYVYGKPVCPRCAVLIIQAGVKRVVALQPDPKANPDSTTHRTGVISVEMFEQAGIEFKGL